MPRLIIRADAAPRMGTGHVMRCLALAQAARGAGLDVRMVCRLGVGWLRSRLEQEKIPLRILPDAPPGTEAPEALLRQLEDAGLPSPGTAGAPVWLALDGYHFDAACQKAALRAGYRLLVIDDYAHLPEYHCDILLNQNIGAEALDYRGVIGRKLPGPAYALLRREFPEAREHAGQRPAAPRNLLITLGGGDFIDCLERIAAAMTMPALKGRTLRVIQGAMDAGRIQAAFARCPARVEILPGVDDMAGLLQETGLCVTAGGSTCWELCCLGVPFLTVLVAENQRLICQWLAERGYAPRFTPEAFAGLLEDDGGRTRLSARLRDLADGQGARRVIDAMRAVLEHNRNLPATGRRMNILFLGPACPRLEERLRELGHAVTRREEALDTDFLRAGDFHFCVSYRYRHILPRDMLDCLHGRAINLHSSLLPWNRGSDPNLWSFLEDTPKGVTIHIMDAGLDTGDILVQREVFFDPAGETLKTTYTKLSTMLEDLFLANAEALLAGSIPARKQPPGGSCHRYRDKMAFLDLIEEKWWDTPVSPLIGAALRRHGQLVERERERERERENLTLRDARRQPKLLFCAGGLFDATKPYAPRFTPVVRWRCRKT